MPFFITIMVERQMSLYGNSQQPILKSGTQKRPNQFHGMYFIKHNTVAIWASPKMS